MQEVVSADFDEQMLTLGDGSTLGYTSLVIATGSKPRVSSFSSPSPPSCSDSSPTQRLRISGRQLEGIITFRSYQDAAHLRKLVEHSRDSGRLIRIAIIGSSFLGTELATLLTSSSTRGAVKVTLISRDALPLESVRLSAELS